MKIKYILLFLLFYCFSCEAQTWNLVSSDEFDSAGINTLNWTYDIGGTGWGNNELEYYTNRPENARTINGNLLVIARQESYSGKNYTSARLKTQGLRSFIYGKIEARIKLPVGQGLWPAFWMLGSNISQVGWPQCGEIDVMEHVSNSSNTNGTMHWNNNGHASYGGQTPCDVTKYHVYSIAWDSASIKWFLDGNKYWEGNILNNINSTEEFHLPFFLLLNFAVGGNWPGNPDVTTPFPDTMYVDYVRVYQLANNTGKNDRTPAPGRFALLHNYPHPYNSSAAISFRLSAPSSVELKLFDFLGRAVTTLVSEKLPVGSYSRQWNIGGEPGGIYIYRLKAGSFIETKEFVLLK